MSDFATGLIYDAMDKLGYTRLCPLCGGSCRQPIYRYTTTFAGEQAIYACLRDTMVYASNDAAADYRDRSQYARLGATGSGVGGDHARLHSTAQIIESLNIPKQASILDIGAAQGGLLDCLRELGYTNIAGIDQSILCVEAIRKRGHTAYSEGDIFGKFDLVILSHVLEHVDDVRGLLATVLNHLAPTGGLYIEVPDVESYGAAGDPFLDFNSEHVNHFSRYTLELALSQSGLAVTRPPWQATARKVLLANGHSYGVLWALAARPEAIQHTMGFVTFSEAKMASLNSHLVRKLANEREVILWGAGEFLAHILQLPVFGTLAIAQVVDSYVEDRLANGLLVMKPSEIFSDCPIVISALVAAPAIKKQIEAMGLTNRIIELRFD
jgi:SAM-dependent methyltransferase